MQGKMTLLSKGENVLKRKLYGGNLTEPWKHVSKGEKEVRVEHKLLGNTILQGEVLVRAATRVQAL